MSLIGIVIDAQDVPAQQRFWAQAIVGEPGVALTFVPAQRPKAGKNRLHLDLASGPDQAGEVRRLLDLGARHVDIGQGDVPWTVLIDPEGNEFCVLDRPADSAGSLVAICQDAADPEAQSRFWGVATGWSIVEQGDWGVSMQADNRTGPMLVMGPPVAPKRERNRLRMTLTADGDALLAAGATRAGDLLIDPEGNELQLANLT